MRLITRFELAHLANKQLSALFKRVSEELPGTEAGSAERRNALASLEDIRREQASRRFQL